MIINKNILAIFSCSADMSSVGRGEDPKYLQLPFNRALIDYTSMLVNHQVMVFILDLVIEQQTITAKKLE